MQIQPTPDSARPRPVSSGSTWSFVPRCGGSQTELLGECRTSENSDMELKLGAIAFLGTEFRGPPLLGPTIPNVSLSPLRSSASRYFHRGDRCDRKSHESSGKGLR